MCYCMIWLTLEQNFFDECDVSARQLWALFTYWCHMCWLIIPPKSEPTHVTPVREQGLYLKGRHVAHIDKCMLQSKSNHTINHSWSHEQYTKYSIMCINWLVLCVLTDLLLYVFQLDIKIPPARGGAIIIAKNIFFTQPLEYTLQIFTY